MAPTLRIPFPRVTGSTTPGWPADPASKDHTMTDLMTLHHVVDGAAVTAPVSFEHRNPADPADLRIALPQADAALIDSAAGAAARACETMARRGIEQRADALATIGRGLVAAADGLALRGARDT